MLLFYDGWSTVTNIVENDFEKYPKYMGSLLEVISLNLRKSRSTREWISYIFQSGVHLWKASDVMTRKGYLLDLCFFSYQCPLYATGDYY